MDPMMIAAIGLLAAAVVFVIFSSTGGGASFPKVSMTTPRSPARSLIEHLEETGREAAARHIEERLGKHKAGEVVKTITAAFAEPAPAPEAPKV